MTPNPTPSPALTGEELDELERFIAPYGPNGHVEGPINGLYHGEMKRLIAAARQSLAPPPGDGEAVPSIMYDGAEIAMTWHRGDGFAAVSCMGHRLIGQGELVAFVRLPGQQEAYRFDGPQTEENVEAVFAEVAKLTHPNGVAPPPPTPPAPSGELVEAAALKPKAVLQAEERVRTDAADTMHRDTTSDLSARLMCRVGARELGLVLAWMDQISITDNGENKVRVAAVELSAALDVFWNLDPGKPTHGAINKVTAAQQALRAALAAHEAGGV